MLSKWIFHNLLINFGIVVYLKIRFDQSCFSKHLLIDFKIAAYVKACLKGIFEGLLIDFKTLLYFKIPKNDFKNTTY